MHRRSSLTRGFLFVYLCLLFGHAIEEWQHAEPLTLLAFGLGGCAALYAHSRTGTLLFVLLLSHMTVEWAGYGAGGLPIAPLYQWMVGLHTLFDVVFLVMVSRELWQGRSVRVLVTAALALVACASAGVFFFSGAVPNHEVALLEGLLLGGMLGCTVYHLAMGRWTTGR